MVGVWRSRSIFKRQTLGGQSRPTHRPAPRKLSVAVLVLISPTTVALLDRLACMPQHQQLENLA
jgi:hypothetical protein